MGADEKGSLSPWPGLSSPSGAGGCALSILIDNGARIWNGLAWLAGWLAGWGRLGLIWAASQWPIAGGGGGQVVVAEGARPAHRSRKLFYFSILAPPTAVGASVRGWGRPSSTQRPITPSLGAMGACGPP